jgi:hypothetical protein
MRTRCLALVLASLALIAVACSSDDEATPATSPTPTAPGTTTTPAVTPGSDVTATATATPPGSATSTGTGASLSPLQKVDSFRYAVALAFGPADGSAPDPNQTGSLTLTGAYVAPDRSTLDLSLKSSAFPFEIKTVQVGDVLYTNLGGTWQQSSAADGSLVSSFLPTSQRFYDAFALDDLAALGNYTVEERNGMTVKHFSLDKEALGRIAEQAGQRGAVRELLKADDLHMDLYVADAENYLVGLRFTGVAATNPLDALLGGTPVPDAKVKFQMSLDLTNIGDPTISIEPPV